MPQMMPINWFILMYMFIIIFLLMNIMNYYIFTNKMILPNKKNFMKVNNYNWKW